MIVIAGNMVFDPADLPAFTEAVRAMVADVRAEDGCLHYSLMVEDPVSGTVNATEIWRDEAALKTHFGQKWIADFMQKFGTKIKQNGLMIYDVTGARPLAL